MKICKEEIFGPVQVAIKNFLRFKIDLLSVVFKSR